MSVAVLLSFCIISATLAYKKQPAISDEYKESLQISDFRSNTAGDERALILSDNKQALEERIRLIENAGSEIILSTFQLLSDSTGKVIMGALNEAANRGVKVKILVDGTVYWPFMKLNPYYYLLNLNSNIEIKIYNKISLFMPWKSMGRMHDKYIIGDNRIYILGGRNTTDISLGNGDSKVNFDRDVMVYNTNTEAPSESVRAIKKYFHTIWNAKESEFYENRFFKADSKIVNKAKTDLKTCYQKYIGTMQSEQPEEYESYTYPTRKISLIQNPIYYQAKEPTIFYTLTELMKSAKKEVRLHTPYIISNDVMYNALKEIARKTKNKISIMTNSVANNGNPFGAADYSTNKGRILETGVKILEYEGGNSYHGKSILIDDNISIIGSFNYDMRSVYLDTELMLVIDSPEINKALDSDMKEYEKQSREVVDEINYKTNENIKPREITSKCKKRINFIKKYLSNLRYLF